MFANMVRAVGSQVASNHIGGMRFKSLNWPVSFSNRNLDKAREIKAEQGKT